MVPDGAAFNVIKVPEAPAGYLFIRELAFYRKWRDGRNRNFAAVAGYLVAGKGQKTVWTDLLRALQPLRSPLRNTASPR